MFFELKIELLKQGNRAKTNLLDSRETGLYTSHLTFNRRSVIERTKPERVCQCTVVVNCIDNIKASLKEKTLVDN